MKKSLIAIMILLLAMACSKEPQKVDTTATPKGPALAEANGTIITAEDVRHEFSILPPQIKEVYSSENGLASLVEELVKKELLYQAGMKKGYTSSPEFKNDMAEFKKRLVIEHLLRDEIEQKAAVESSAAKAFYDANIKSFQREVPGSDKPETIDFALVEGLIKDRLVAEKQKLIFEQYIEGVMKAATITINQEAINTAFGNSPSSTP